MQATGHILLGSSCYIEQLLEEEEEEQSADKSLALPQKSKIKQLQTMLMGKMSLWCWTEADDAEQTRRPLLTDLVYFVTPLFFEQEEHVLSHMAALLPFFH